MIPILITLDGFMSYRTRQQLDFTGASLWLLSGENGAGKSAVFDAITYVLYSVCRGRKTNHIELINHARNDLRVELDFEHEGQIFRAFRTIHRPVGHRRPETSRQILKILPAEPDGRPVPGTDTDEGFRDWVKEHIRLDYDAFTASVLLRQGHADRLLTVDPIDRYNILSRLIDLDRYQRLHDKAEILQKEHKIRLEDVRTRRSRVPEVTDAQIQQVEQQLANKDEEVHQAEERKQEAQDYLALAAQWEAHDRRMRELNFQEETDRPILANTEKIQTRFSRWEDLRTVIPQLQQVLAAQGRIHKYEQDAGRLSLQVDGMSGQIQDAQSRADRLSQLLSDLDDVIGQLSGEHTQMLSRIATLSGLEAQLDRLGEAKSLHEKLLISLGQFPENLDCELDTAEQASKACGLARDSLAPLTRIAEERRALHQAVDGYRKAQNDSSRLSGEIQTLDTEMEAIDQELASARIEEERLGNASSLASAALQVAEETLSNFQSVSTSPTCPFCGQKITPDHAEEEKDRLEKNVTAKRRESQKALDSYENYTRRSELEQKARDLSGRRRDLGYLTQTEAGKIRVAKAASTQAISRLSGAYNDLSEAYAVQVSPSGMPVDEADWLETIYPTDEDLYSVRSLASRANERQRTAQELSRQVNDRERIQRQMGEAQQAITRISNALPADYAAVIVTMQKERDQAESLAETIRQKRIEAGDLRGQVQSATDGLNRLISDRNDLKRQAGEKIAARNETQLGLAALYEQFPTQWREIAGVANEEIVRQLTEEFAMLSTADDQKRKLDIARERAVRNAEEKSFLADKIEEIPEAARITTVHARQNLADAGRDYNALHQEWEEIENRLGDLRRTRQNRDELDQLYRDHDRLYRHYSTLATAFGETGIQKQIMRDAENEIVQSANHILSGLSAGRCRIALKPEDTSKKALDLVAIDDATGGQPISVELTSGSQQFRVAVSLALAIGRYVRRDSHNAESVIIDEGFGSLDRAGREAAIQEIANLRDQLERIILVSHQDEFAARFSTGYRIVLENGTSMVRDAEAVFE